MEQLGEHGTITLRTRETPDFIKVSVEGQRPCVPPELSTHLSFLRQDHGRAWPQDRAPHCQEHGGG
jgi:hypothetical protein